MGFKHVSIEELETKLSPNFLGTPLKHIGKIIEKETIKKEIQISKIELPDIYLFTEDKIEYTYDNGGNLKDFIGNGSISVLNHSKKDRIWDARVKVSGIQNVNIESEDEILLGNLEPETNKKIKYNVFNSENLVNPIKLTESIKVLNIEAKSAKKLIIEKKPQIIAVDDISFQIKEIGSKLAVEKENLEDADKTVAEWTEKVESIEKIVNSLNEARNSYSRTKSKTQSMIKKKYNVKKKKKEISDFNSTIKEHEKLIKVKKNDLTKLNEDYSKKEDQTKKEIESEFNPQIEKIVSQKSAKQEELEKAIENITKWTTNKNEIDKTVKSQKKELNSILKAKSKAQSAKIKSQPDDRIKEKTPKEESIKKIEKVAVDPQITGIDSQVSTEQKKLDNAINNFNEWTGKKKELSEKIKNLKKERGNLLKAQKAKSKSHPEDKIKEKTPKEESVKKIEKVVVDPQITRIDSQVSTEQKKLDNAINNFNEWTVKKKELNEKIKNLKKERGHLLRAQKTKLKSSPKDEIEEKTPKEVDPQIISIDSQLNTEQKNLDNAIKNIDEWSGKKKELSDKIKDLKKERGNLLKAQKAKLKTHPEDKIKEKTPKEESIKKIEKEVVDPQIISIDSQLNTEQKNLDNAIKNIDEWSGKKKELSDKINDLKKERGNLLKAKSKEPKKSNEPQFEEINTKFDPDIKAKETKIATNQETLDEAIKNANEWMTKKKEISKEIKELEKEIDSLEKNKIRTTNATLKKLEKEKNTKIKETEGQIEDNENEIEKIKSLSSLEDSSLKEIDEEYAPKIKEIESKLSEEGSKLKDAKRNSEKWHKKKDSLSDYINNLEKEYGALIQADPETQSIRLKRILGEEGIEKFQPASGLNISELQKNHLLMFNKENSLEFSIILENDTNSPMENITLGKSFSEDFSAFQCKSSASSEISINKGNIIWNVNEIKPAEIVELRITTDIIPKDKKIIGTGAMQLSYDYKDYLISGIDIESFSAYSHAMHAMRIKEKENEPYQWDCSIFFQNNSQINMELRSILVLDENKQEKYLDLKYDQEKLLISPGESYSTEKWEVSDENEPKFYRKLEYSVTHTTNKKTNINLKIEENVFNIVDAKISKKFSKTEIKSFEEDRIENLINIKNAGSIGIEAVSIEDHIPVDFRPPLTLDGILIRNSSGIINSDNIELKLTPEDDDPSKSHVIKLMIKGDSKSSKDLIKVNDFIEIKYDFDAVKPNYKVKYEFPLKITTLYPKYRGRNSDYYKIQDQLNQEALPNLRIVHKRRNLIIGKSIFPGRSVNEFGISIMVNNKSNSEINDIKITDTISKSFELISSNIQSEISESDDDKSNVINFLIDSILPYQEKEIRYYLQNNSGEEIGYDELESYIFG